MSVPSASRESLPAVSGILFVVVYVVALLLIDVPGGKDSDAEIVSFYDDTGDRIRVIAGTHVLVLGAGLFLWFLGSLWRAARPAEGESGRLSVIAVGSGFVFAAMVCVSAVATGAVAAAMDFGDVEQADPGVARFLPRMGHDMLLLPGSFTALVMVVAVAVLTLRTGLFPRWMAWLSYLCAVALLASAAVPDIPQVGLLVWVVVASALLMRQEAPAR